MRKPLCKFNINCCMIVSQAADDLAQVRPTPTVRDGQKQKRQSLTNSDIINRDLLPGADSETQKESNHDDDMRVCIHCKQSFYIMELFRHMEKCGKHK